MTVKLYSPNGGAEAVVQDHKVEQMLASGWRKSKAPKRKSAPDKQPDVGTDPPPK